MTRVEKAVWKYALSPLDEAWDGIVLSMPTQARILRVEEQNTHICLWALVDTETEEREDRRFMVVGTGWPVSEGDYLGTVQLRGTALVFHVFETPLRTASTTPTPSAPAGVRR